MNKFTSCTSQSSRWIAAAVVLSITVICAPVSAEYRCAAPEQLTNAEKTACELARQDSPDALTHFVNRTKAIYNLLVDDYVSNADVKRWEAARSNVAPDSSAAAKVRIDTNAASRAH